MFTNAATRDVGGDPIGDILRRVAVFVRGYIQSAPRAVRLPVDAILLPESLISPAMDYAAVDVLKKIALPVTEERKTARRSDDIFMLDILREEIRHGDTRLQRDISL